MDVAHHTEEKMHTPRDTQGSWKDAELNQVIQQGHQVELGFLVPLYLCGDHSVCAYPLSGALLPIVLEINFWLDV